MRLITPRRSFLRTVALSGAATRLLPGAGMGSGPGPRVAESAAASADWVRFGYNLHNTRFNPAENELGRENVGRLRQKWRFETDSPIQTTPSVVGDTLFFGTLAGYQYALEASTGREKWRFFAGDLGEGSPGSPGVRSSAQYHDGRLYFGTGLARVHCLDAQTGREIWQTQIDEDPVGNRAQIFCSVAVHGGRLYVGTSSAEAQAVCLDAASGRVRWRFYVVEKHRRGGGSIWTSPAVDGSAGIVYFGTGSLKSYHPPDAMLYSESMLAFDGDSGEMIWYDQVRMADAFDLDFSCHPMIFDAPHPGRGESVRPCLAAGSKGGIYCWNRFTGERYWKSMLTSSGPASGPILNSTAAAYDRVFVISNAALIRGRSASSVTAALDAYTGDIVWWFHNPAHVRGPVAVANQVFYQGLADGTLSAIDASNGEELWSHRLPSPLRGGMAICRGTLYTSAGAMLGWRAGTSDQTFGVYAFTPEGD